VLSVIGPVDEIMITEIMATPATIDSAWAWINSDEALMNEGQPLPADGQPNGRTAELIDLLLPQDDED
jgi:hypothetical protein